MYKRNQLVRLTDNHPTNKYFTKGGRYYFQGMLSNQEIETAIVSDTSFEKGILTGVSIYAIPMNIIGLPVKTEMREVVQNLIAQAGDVKDKYSQRHLVRLADLIEDLEEKEA